MTMQEQTMEIWGLCGDCARWFLIPSDTVRALLAAACPTCKAAPLQLEQRLGDLIIELDVQGGRTPDAWPGRPARGVA